MLQLQMILVSSSFFLSLFVVVVVVGFFFLLLLFGRPEIRYSLTPRKTSTYLLIVVWGSSSDPKGKFSF